MVGLRAGDAGWPPVGSAGFEPRHGVVIGVDPVRRQLVSDDLRAAEAVSLADPVGGRMVGDSEDDLDRQV